MSPRRRKDRPQAAFPEPHARREESKRAQTGPDRNAPEAHKRQRDLEAERAIHRATERKLEQYRVLLDALLDSTGDLFSVKRADGAYQAASMAFCQFARRAEDQIRGCTDFQVFPETIATVFHRYDTMVVRNGRPYCWDEPLPGTEGRWFRFFKRPLFSAEQECIGLLCAARDITAARRLERQVRTLSRKDSLPGLTLDARGCILEANPAFCAASGFNRADLLGQELRTLEQPSGIGAGAPRLDLLARAGFAEFTMVLRARRHTAEVRVEAVYVESDGGRFHCVFPDLAPAPPAAFAPHYEGPATPFPEPAPGFEPVRPVDPELWPPAKEESEVDSRTPLDGHWQLVDLNEIAREAMEQLRSALPPHVRIEQDFERHPFLCMGSHQQLLQAITVLLTNAAEAIESRGLIRVATRNAQIGPELVQTFSHLRPGPYVLVAVEDNGRGIHPRLLDKIFDPFITTKFRGRGMGLPSACRNVRDHGGDIAVKSVERQGSVFTIYLPAIKEKQTIPQRGQWTFPSSMETVLVADADRGALQTAQDLLERLAFTVLTASAANAALHKMQTHHKPIHLALVDEMLIRQSPVPLLPRLRANRPHMKILVMSVPGAGLSRQSLTEQGASGFIDKPLAPDALVAKIRHALDSEHLYCPE